MSSRPFIVHQVANTQPNGQQLGDEWFNPVTNQLNKNLAVNGNAVSAVEIVINRSGNISVTGNLTVSGVSSLVGNVNMSSALGVGTSNFGNVGEIRATNNITAFFSSDQRFKANVKPIANALGIVAQVGGKTFDWTDEYISAHGGEDSYFVQKSDFGIIAQDIQKVFPQAVRVRPDGTLAVDYEKLVAVAFQAIVELQAEIDTLKKGR